MLFNSIKEINRLRKEINMLRKKISRLFKYRNTKYLLKVCRTNIFIQFHRFKKKQTQLKTKQVKQDILNQWESMGFPKLYWENLTFSKLRFSKFKRISHQASFWGDSTHADIIQFQNIFLQLKNKSSRSKTMCGFSVRRRQLNFLLYGPDSP